MKACVGVVLCALLVVLVDAQLEVKRRSITVLSPHKLRTEQDGAIANYGLPNYEGFIIGSLVYPTKGSLGCHHFEGNKPFINFFSLRPTIVLLDRGECYFVKKVWHAQKAGAGAVLVADNVREPLISMDVPGGDDRLDEIMKNISIPSALIEKSFGDMLKEALNNKDLVLLKFDWRKPGPHLEGLGWTARATRMMNKWIPLWSTVP